jgi:hypothetical protein
MPGSPFHYLSVRIGEDAIAEVKDGYKPVLEVPKEEIQEIELTRGSDSARPLAQCAFGGGLVGLGLLLVVYGGELPWWWQVGFALTFVAGGWIIFDAIRPVTLLRLRTIRGVKKVAFRGRVRREELEDFLQAAEREFGYVIERRI